MFVIVFAALVMQGFTSCNSCSRKNTEGFVIPDSIYDGDEYIDDFGAVVCRNCIDNMTAEELLSFLNISILTAYAGQL